MKLANKPRLRSALRRLYAANIDWSDSHVRGMATQEAIDFVAMMAGVKPVYITGRGFDHDGWRAAVLELAASNRLYVVPGAYWEAVRPPSDLPGWFVEIGRRGLAEGRAHYIAKGRAVADELKAIAEEGRPGIAQEARLLGFPVCCVESHYDAAAAFERATFEILSRRADGDEAEMKRIAEGPEPVRPESEEEHMLLTTAVSVRPARYTSLNMCERCAADPASPGARLSATYGALVEALAGRKRRDRARRRG